MSQKISYFKKVNDSQDTYNGLLRVDISFELEDELATDDYITVMSAIDSIRGVAEKYGRKLQQGVDTE